MDSFRALLDVLQPVAIAAMAFVVTMDLTGNKRRTALFIALIAMSFYMAVDKPNYRDAAGTRAVYDAQIHSELASIRVTLEKLLITTKDAQAHQP